MLPTHPSGPLKHRITNDRSMMSDPLRHEGGSCELVVDVLAALTDRGVALRTEGRCCDRGETRKTG